MAQTTMGRAVRGSLTASLSIIALVSAGGPAQAQGAASTIPSPTAPETADDDGSDALADIVVTARRRNESLLSVPLGVTALTSETLERLNVRDFRELSRSTPGFQFPETTTFFGQTRQNTNANYVIRGLNIPGAAFLFIDGAPYSNGRIDTFLNAERVEILKGPQAAYFGRNTFAGAVNIVTKTPANQWGGRVSVQAATYNTYIGDATIEGPLIADKLLVRLAVHRDHFGGQYRDVAKGERLGRRNTTEVSGTIYIKPVEELSIKLFGDYTKIDDGPALGGMLQLNTEGNCRLTPNSPLFFCGRPSLTRAVAGRGVPAVFDAQYKTQIVDRFTPFGGFIDQIGLASRAEQFNAIVDYDFGPVAFNAIASHSRYRAENVGEISQNPTFFPCRIAAGCGRPFGQALFYGASEAKTDSVEARLTTDQSWRVRGTLGVNYVYQYIFTPGTSGDLPQLPAAFSNGGSLQRVDTYSVFGGLYFDILENLTISGEGRFQWDKIENTPGKSAAAINAIPGNVGKQILDPTNRISGTFKNFAPRITLQYKPDANMMIFANYAKGFVPGNFNTILRSAAIPAAAKALLAAQGAELEVDEQVLQQYEGGIKGSLFGGRLAGSLVGYFGTVDNQQIPSATINFVDGNVFLPLSFLSNDGKTKIRGVELEAQFNASRNLRLGGSFAWNSIKIKFDRCAFCLTYAGSSGADIGNRLPNVPQYTASFNARYSDQLTDELDWYVLGDYSFRGNIYATPLNRIRSGTANRVNLKAGVESRRIGFELFVDNVTNNKTIPSFGTAQRYQLPPVGQSASVFTQAITVGFPDKRVFGVRANYSF